MANALPFELDRAEPWFPGLAHALADRVRREGPLRLGQYDSQSWLSEYANPGVPELGHLRLGARQAAIEAPSPFLHARYRPLGLSLSAECSGADLDLLKAAIVRIAEVPDLFKAVVALVRSIHLLEPPGPGHDVSHSDPELPFSIFVSLAAGEAHADLRVAESIIHETMHLQLTLIEANYPLVRQDDPSTLYSPWQRQNRPLGGLLHGLYVFAVIDAFLARIEPTIPEGERFYIAKRQRAIAEEKAAVLGLRGHGGLTKAGRALVSVLFDDSPAVTAREN